MHTHTQRVSASWRLQAAAELEQEIAKQRRALVEELDEKLISHRRPGMSEEPEELMTHSEFVDQVERLRQKAVKRLEELFEEGEATKEQLAVIKTIFQVADYMRRTM